MAIVILKNEQAVWQIFQIYQGISFKKLLLIFYDKEWFISYKWSNNWVVLRLRNRDADGDVLSLPRNARWSRSICIIRCVFLLIKFYSIISQMSPVAPWLNILALTPPLKWLLCGCNEITYNTWTYLRYSWTYQYRILL